MVRGKVVLVLIGLLSAALIVGCAAPTAQGPGRAAQEKPAPPQKPEAAKPAEQVQVGKSYIENDKSTGEISGSCTLAILSLPSLGRRLDQANYALKNLANLLSRTTKVNVDPSSGVRTVSSKDVRMLNAPFLLVKPAKELSNPSVRESLAEYVKRGGFILVDGRWSAELIPGAKRSTIPKDHQILLYPYKIGTLPGELRKMEIEELEGRTVALITYGELTPQWRRMISPRGAATLQAKLGINAIIYALTQGKLCDNSKFDITKDPKAKEFLRLHMPKRRIELEL